MLLIGLTGGIGSGKSVVAEQFSKLGCAVTDTDAIAHRLTAKGQAALDEIAAAFGRGILLADGALNRPLLREKVFADANAKQTLEKILHPRIREAVETELAEDSKAPYRMVVIPLLVETGAYDHMLHRVLLVDCPEALQIRRVLARGASDEAEIRAIIATQCSREQRISRADDIIINDAGHEKMLHQVTELHKKYLSLAEQNG